MEHPHLLPPPRGLTRALGVAVVLTVTLAFGACRRERSSSIAPVVIYTSLDRSFSEPILTEFSKRTGIEVRPVYDTESTKTVGLVNRIRAERNRPRCDVFWNNEILNTLLLAQEGLLRPTTPANAAHYPPGVRDPGSLWHGFAARARVLIVNTELLAGGPPPGSMYDLLDAKWRGRIGIAKPVAGTTASHVACLFALLGEADAVTYLEGLKANEVSIESGNKSCARNVASGVLAMAWTDTDDAIIEVERGYPVMIVYPDNGPNGVGTLFIPNTLTALAGSPNSSGADRLIDYLLSPDVEQRLAAGPSAQIPLGRESVPSTRTRGPKEVKSMSVDFAEAARQWPAAQTYIQTQFLK